MHFYRTINQIQAFTFDLDDTLYDNSFIVDKAEEELIKTLQQYDLLHNITKADYFAEKNHALENNSEIYHDVILWRVETIKLILTKVKFPNLKITHIIDECIATFNIWRHKIHVPQATHTLLTKLATKYPLGVITNGNVDIAKIGLGDYFQFSLRGGPDGRSKPFPEIFELASKKLNVPAHHILHIGDNLSTDVNGAINSDFLACWINIFNQDIFHLSDARSLPHIEITQLSELDNLL